MAIFSPFAVILVTLSLAVALGEECWDPGDVIDVRPLPCWDQTVARAAVVWMLHFRSSAALRSLDSSAAALCQATSDPGVAGQRRCAIKGVAREDTPVAAATGPHPPDSRSRLLYFDRPPSVERARTQRSRNVRPECAGAVEHHFLHGISFL